MRLVPIASAVLSFFLGYFVHWVTFQSVEREVLYGQSSRKEPPSQLAGEQGPSSKGKENKSRVQAAADDVQDQRVLSPLEKEEKLIQTLEGKISQLENSIAENKSRSEDLERRIGATQDAVLSLERAQLSQKDQLFQKAAQEDLFLQMQVVDQNVRAEQLKSEIEQRRKDLAANDQKLGQEQARGFKSDELNRLENQNRQLKDQLDQLSAEYSNAKVQAGQVSSLGRLQQEFLRKNEFESLGRQFQNELDRETSKLRRLQNQSEKTQAEIQQQEVELDELYGELKAHQTTYHVLRSK